MSINMKTENGYSMLAGNPIEPDFSLIQTMNNTIDLRDKMTFTHKGTTGLLFDFPNITGGSTINLDRNGDFSLNIGDQYLRMYANYGLNAPGIELLNYNGDEASLNLYEGKAVISAGTCTDNPAVITVAGDSGESYINIESINSSESGCKGSVYISGGKPDYESSIEIKNTGDVNVYSKGDLKLQSDESGKKVQLYNGSTGGKIELTETSKGGNMIYIEAGDESIELDDYNSKIKIRTTAGDESEISLSDGRIDITNYQDNVKLYINGIRQNPITKNIVIGEWNTTPDTIDYSGGYSLRTLLKPTGTHKDSGLYKITYRSVGDYYFGMAYVNLNTYTNQPSQYRPDGISYDIKVQMVLTGGDLIFGESEDGGENINVYCDVRPMTYNSTLKVWLPDFGKLTYDMNGFNLSDFDNYYFCANDSSSMLWHVEKLDSGDTQQKPECFVSM